MPIALGGCLILVFFLSYGVRIGLSTLSTETDKGIFGDIVCHRLEAVGKSLAEDLTEIVHCHAVLGTTRPGRVAR